jgi:hypothetical protein
LAGFKLIYYGAKRIIGYALFSGKAGEPGILEGPHWYSIAQRRGNSKVTSGFRTAVDANQNRYWAGAVCRGLVMAASGYCGSKGSFLPFSLNNSEILTRIMKSNKLL